MTWGLTAKRAAPVERDWYYNADPARRSEYDAFGPWIGVVRSEEDMPPRFQHAYEELRASVFLYKIPIKADRRAVRPGMDLYRAVLAVSAEHVVVLEWDGVTETRYESPLSRIQSVRIDQDLLPAALSLLLDDGRTVTLGYSSVSDKDIEQVVSFLRERMSPGPEAHRKPPADPSERPGISVDDSFYRSMSWKHVRRSPSARFLYWEQPGVRLGGLKSSLGCLLLDAGNELVVIHRGRFVRRWLEAVYSSTEQYFPWSAVQSVELVQRPNGRKSSISAVKIVVRGHAISVELYAASSRQEQLVAEMRARMVQ